VTDWQVIVIKGGGKAPRIAEQTSEARTPAGGSDVAVIRKRSTSGAVPFACALLYSPQRETIGSGAHFGQVAAPIGSPPKNSAILTGPADRELSYTTALSASEIA
jgi:hypothetical protein